MVEHNARVQRVPGTRAVSILVISLLCLPSVGWARNHAEAAKELSAAFSEERG